MDTAEPVWVPAEQPPVPDLTSPSGERVPSPTANIKEEEGKMAADIIVVVVVVVVVMLPCCLFSEFHLLSVHLSRVLLFMYSFIFKFSSCSLIG